MHWLGGTGSAVPTQSCNKFARRRCLCGSGFCGNYLRLERPNQDTRNLGDKAKRRSVMTTEFFRSCVPPHPSANGVHKFMETLTPCSSSCTLVCTLSPSIPGGPYCQHPQQAKLIKMLLYGHFTLGSGFKKIFKTNNLFGYL